MGFKPPTTEPRIRLGEIRFVNAYPLSSAVGEQLAEEAIPGLSVRVASPAQLNQAMLAGQLDISPVSSVFYARHANRFRVLSGTCIASQSPVRSVLFVAPQDWKNPARSKRIWLPDTSETSIFLMQWMLAQDGITQYQTLTYLPGQAETLYQQGETLLTIGDEALQLEAAIQALPSEKRQLTQVIDIARYWKARTGFPCVFAVWVAQTDFVERYPEAINVIENRLKARQEAFYLNPKHQNRVLRDLAEANPALLQAIGHQGLQDYLCRSLTYNLDETAQASLAMLHSLCAQPHLSRPNDTPISTRTSTQTHVQPLSVPRDHPESLQQPVHR